GLQAERSLARSGHAPGHARRAPHHAHRARVCAPRVLLPQHRPGADAPHDRPARVGARLRYREQHHRRVRRVSPPQDRRLGRAPAPPGGEGRGIHARPGGVTLRLSPLSIRTRLTLWYSAILLGILTVTSVLGYSALRWSLLQDLDASLLTVAQALADTSAATRRPDDLETEAFLREL